MTHVGCPNCRLRFTPAAAAHLVLCSDCGPRLQRIAGAESAVGFGVLAAEGVLDEQPAPLAVTIAMSGPAGARP